MSNGTAFLSETTLEDSDTLLLLFKVASEDREKKYIWNISDNSLAWEDYPSFRSYLNKDFGQYHLYIAYRDKTKLGMFGLLNLYSYSECANILIWVDKSVRKGLLPMRWFVLFLQEAQKKHITQLYARIKLLNTVSLNSSKRFGFVQCTSIPQPLSATNQNNDNESVSCVTRNTGFDDFERKYLKRYISNMLEDKKPNKSLE